MGEYDYFYPHNSDQYAFYRIPKRLFTDRDLKTMTNGSKILYGLLLDRVDLSARNRWIDEANRIFIIYPREEICDHMGCAPKTATKLVVELEDRGLVERRIQGLGKPAVLYVKNFASRGQDLPVQRGKSYPSGGVRNTFPEGQVLPGNNTEYKDTDWNDTDLILSGEKQMRERSQLETFIREQLGYQELLHEFPMDRETIDGIMTLVVDCCSSSQDYITISGDRKPVGVIRSQMMKLTPDHIRYVLNGIKGVKSDIRNMKQYLISSLYNAPITIDPHYTTMVNHDMASGPGAEGGEWQIE